MTVFEVTIPIKGKTVYLELTFQDSKDGKDWSITLDKRGRPGRVFIGFVSKASIKRLGRAS